MNLSGFVWSQFGLQGELPENEVHVWRISVDTTAAGIAQFMQVLSPDERERADRFHFEADRQRSVIGRGALRLLLGRILNSRPDLLELSGDEFGKPRLSGTHPALEFNLSHSGNVILIAMAWGRAVGVDVEKIRTDLELDEIAARFFSTNECVTLAAQVGPARYQAFFTCWTRKEAYVKAKGAGLLLPLDQFDVSFLPHEEPRLLATRMDPAEAGRWRLVALHPSPELDPSPEYVAALVASGSDWTLKCWDLDPQLLVNGAG